MNKSKGEILDNLMKLNYFLHSENMENAIELTFQNYQNNGILNFPDNELKRLFYIEAESNFESEGLKDTFDEFIQLMKHYGLKLKMISYDEIFDRNSGMYTIRKAKINKRNYIVKDISSWRESFISSVEVLNEILEDHKIEERLYGLFMDESSVLILLTKDQYNYLSQLIPAHAEFKPTILINEEEENVNNESGIEITENKKLHNLLEKTKNGKLTRINLTKFRLRYLPPEILEMTGSKN